MQLASYLLKNWLELLTGAILGAALITWIYAGQQGAAQTGDFVSGFSSALAFLWLIAGFRNQTKELATQRAELKLQRAALEAQTAEMQNAARFAGLAQIATLVDRANASVAAAGLPDVRRPSDLSAASLKAMKLFKVLQETRSAELYIETYGEYQKIEAANKSYLSGMASALKLHLDYINYSYDAAKEDDEFLYTYSDLMKRVPHLAQHHGVVLVTAQSFWLQGRMRKAALYGSMVAAAKIMGPEVLIDGALEKMRAELESEGIPLPAIAG